MPDSFYVDLPRLNEYAEFLKQQVRLMEEAGDVMHKKVRDFRAVFEDEMSGRVEEELRVMQRNIDGIRAQVDKTAAETRQAAELYQLYLQRGDIV